MLAELKDPETANIIAESLATKFVDISREKLVNIKFNYDQRIAIKCFFENCEKLYDYEYFDNLSKSCT